MTTVQAPPKYAAFLSYSHADARKAKRWQRRLEAFRFDEPLIRLGAPASLAPVFRDRDDFPAGGELSALTRKALAESAALVLIASPNAARSKAVNEEVRLFRHDHPDRKLVVILDAPRKARFQDCLPEALRFELDSTGAVTDRPFTPLAADPRAGADGAAAASAKVIAGLTGLEVSDLLGRVEAALRREAWRFRAGVAGWGVLLLVIGGIGWGVWDMRVAQRQEAALAAQRDVDAKAAAAKKDAADTEARQRLERMVQDAAGGGAPAVKAIGAFRDLMRPFNADIDTIPAERLPGLMQQVLDTSRKPGANPADYAGAIGQALAEAQKLNADLQFGAADKALDAALAHTDDIAKGRAALLAEKALTQRLQLHYREAARLYIAASGAVALDDKAAWGYATQAARALYSQGDEFGDNAALTESIQRYRAALDLVPRDRASEDWATTQMGLGGALETLGERDSGTVPLEEAVAADRAALEEWTRDRAPISWAATQNNLATALLALGERESGTARLEQAVAAYRAAQEVLTRDRMPLGWAATQNNLGNALSDLGARESGTARLEEAVAAYRAALAEYTRDRVPLNWATTQNNLGTALQRLGARESGTARLEEAVAAYRAALEERTRDRVPLDWATTQNNLGTALQTLGARESGIARLEEAVAAYRAALEERTRDRVPLNWATTQNNLGIALQTLGARESGTARLEEAVAAYRAALEERTRDRVPLDWATTQNNLNKALWALDERKNGTARLEQAAADYRAALGEWPRDRAPLDWAFSQFGLATTLATMAERTQDRARMSEAIAAMRNAAEVYRQDNVRDWLPIAEQRVKDMEGALAKMP